MSKYRAVYDKLGKRYEEVDGVVTWLRPGEPGEVGSTAGYSHMVIGDIPDFVSPIDGSVVRGRAGLRDHCARHDVVPTAELAGLSMKTMNQQTAPSKEYREATKRTMAEIINSRNY